jgi:HlyD family secretion protein
MALHRSLVKRPLYLLLPVAAVVLALWAFWPRALPVEMAAVVRAPLSVTFTEEGRTRVRQRYRISAPVDGFLQRIVLEPGDAVTAGATVAVLQAVSARLLDPAVQMAAQTQWRAAEQTLMEASAALTAAQAENQRRRATLARVSALASRQLVATAELDLARTEVESGAAAERAALARVTEARVLRDGARTVLQLQGTPADGADDRRVLVRAPVSGRIVLRHLESEGPVQAGQPLLDIGDPADLEVESDILSADAVRIAPGTPVQLTDWGGETPLPAHVRVVEPGAFTKVSALGVEEQRVRAIIAFDPPADTRQTLGDGYRVDARFQVWRGDAVLQVPTAALFRDGDDWAVYAVEGGRARLRRVVLGRFGEGAAEVRSGLAENVLVVLYPGDYVRDGRRVSREQTAR